MSTYQEFQNGENVKSFEMSLFLAYQAADAKNKEIISNAFPNLFAKAEHTPNFHLIEAKFLPATNNLGDRVSIYSHRYNAKIIINYDYGCNSVAEIATKKLEQLGFAITGKAETKHGYALLSSTFKAF